MQRLFGNHHIVETPDGHVGLLAGVGFLGELQDGFAAFVQIKAVAAHGFGGGEGAFVQTAAHPVIAQADLLAGAVKHQTGGIVKLEGNDGAIFHVDIAPFAVFFYGGQALGEGVGIFILRIDDDLIGKVLLLGGCDGENEREQENSYRNF